MKQINGQQIDAFCRALTEKLLDPKAPFGKRYLHLLVDEIRVTGKVATVKGSWKHWPMRLPARKKVPQERCPVLYRIGAPNTNRTCDLPLRRGLLYPLSYRGDGQYFIRNSHSCEDAETRSISLRVNAPLKFSKCIAS